MKEKLSKLLGYELLNKLRSVGTFNFQEFTSLKALIEDRDPFKILLATVLSQNTNDRNSIRAFKKLKEKYILKPEEIALVKREELAETIKPGGMHNLKAEKIISLSRKVVKEFGGDLNIILNKPLKEARKELLKLPGVGFKTADVVLLSLTDKKVFPVDTHIERITKRLGLVDEKAKYEKIRKKLEETFPPDKYLEAHLLLINFGRKICKTRKPKCGKCPIRNKCKYFREKSGRK